jgi:hypothetical protein
MMILHKEENRREKWHEEEKKVENREGGLREE